MVTALDKPPCQSKSVLPTCAQGGEEAEEAEDKEHRVLGFRELECKPMKSSDNSGNSFDKIQENIRIIFLLSPIAHLRSH